MRLLLLLNAYTCSIGGGGCKITQFGAQKAATIIILQRMSHDADLHRAAQPLTSRFEMSITLLR